jgi:hypothetical protein
MFHHRANSAGNSLDVIPSAKATKASALKTAQRLSSIAAPMRSVIGIAGFMLATLSPTIAPAATVEEVAHCRAFPQLAERLNCFKSLKPGPRAKTENAAPAKAKQAAPAKTEQAAPAKAEGAASAKKQDASPSKAKNAARAKTKQAAPAKTQAVPARKEQAAPANAGDNTAPTKTEQASPAKTEQAAPANTNEAAPTKTEQAAPAKTEEVAPAKAETTTHSKDEALFSPMPDDAATTSSIDRLSVAGQPLCVDAEAVGVMLLAGLLTSSPKNAATSGCQALQEGAKLEVLERYPSAFPFIRIVRVRVTSPTQPDLTFGFTIETGR